MTPNTITVYYTATDLRVVRGEHTPHRDADKGRVLVYPSAEFARKQMARDVPEPRRADILTALARIAPAIAVPKAVAKIAAHLKANPPPPVAKCAHPEGCDMPATEGDIYCTDCRSSIGAA